MAALEVAPEREVPVGQTPEGWVPKEVTVELPV
jgi:hypothetical protein